MSINVIKNSILICADNSFVLNENYIYFTRRAVLYLLNFIFCILNQKHIWISGRTKAYFKLIKKS